MAGDNGEKFQVLMFLLYKRTVMVNSDDRTSQMLISVHLHLSCTRFCLLASLCVSLSLCSLLGCRDIIRSTALVICLRGLLHCGLWPVDHWITHSLQLLVGNIRMCWETKKCEMMLLLTEAGVESYSHLHTCIFAMMSATLTAGS